MLPTIRKNGKIMVVVVLIFLLLGLLCRNLVLIFVGQSLLVVFAWKLFRFGTLIATLDRRLIQFRPESLEQDVLSQKTTMQDSVPPTKDQKQSYLTYQEETTAHKKDLQRHSQLSPSKQQSGEETKEAYTDQQYHNRHDSFLYQGYSVNKRDSATRKWSHQEEERWWQKRESLDSSKSTRPENVLWTKKRYEQSVVLLNLSSHVIPEIELIPHLSGPMRGGFSDDTYKGIRLEKHSAQQVAFTVESSLTGRFGMQGFNVHLRDKHGLIEWRDFLPCLEIYRFEVQPLNERQVVSRTSAPPSEESSRLGKQTSALEGDFNQLRAYQWGEPVKNIAWKSSLRKNQLLSREYETAPTPVRQICFDVSSTMRGGLPLGEKLEFSLAFLLGRLRINDRDGIITELDILSEKGIHRLGRAEQACDRSRIQASLSLLRSPTDPDLLEMTETEWISLATEYLRLVERLDFKTHDPVTRLIDRERLLKLEQWISYTLVQDRKRYGDIRQGPLANTITTNPTIEFLQTRGLALSYVSEIRLGKKEELLSKQLAKYARILNRGTEVEILSDLCGLSLGARLVEGVAKAIRKGLGVRFLIVPSTYFTHLDDNILKQFTPQQVERYQTVRGLFATSEHHAQHELARDLMRVGAEVHFLDAHGWCQQP